MSTATVPTSRLTRDDLAPQLRPRWQRAVADTVVVVGRNLRILARQPALIVFATVQPVMFVLLFRYVFGGAIDTPGEYVNYLMPGIFIQTVTFGAIQTGIGLAEDAGAGFIDRLRTLPMSRSALLTGRNLADQVRNVGVVLLMFAVGVAVGFRPEGGVGALLLAGGVILAWSFAISWISAWVGLRFRDAETTQAAMFPILFPLTFASSAFVPVESMPSWLQPIADNQPFTVAVDAVRDLTSGAGWTALGSRSLLWSAALTALLAPLAVRAYRRA